MRKIVRLLVAALALGSPLIAPAQLVVVGDGGPGPVKAQHLTAEMVTLAPQIAAGSQLQAGLTLTLEEKWHVYWLNAGDSGEPPHVVWTLPPGIAAGPMQFPIPERLPLGPLMDFGYEDEVTFPMMLHADASVKPGPIHLDAKVDWLICREVCIPGKAHLGLNLNVVRGPLPAPPVVGSLGEALSLLPQPLPPSAQVTVNSGPKDFAITLITGKPASDIEFYPFDQDQIANAADQDTQSLPNGIRIWVPKDDTLTKSPATLHGLLKLDEKTAYEFTAPVTPGAIASPSSSNASSLTTLSAIGLAFLGGILLNLMPCVFPVLFLKALALVNSSNEERKRLRTHGFIYALGILVSFWLVVALLLALRAGGSQLGWGYQLQSPTFVAVLAAFLFFFALTLAGQFDLGLSLTSAGGSLAQQQGYTGSFFTGVLATVVATPCTAPLMGAAVGFALLQPIWLTFVIFTSMALGLALPYVLLSAQPAWVRLLPKPGAWMEMLKQFTALILFGAAIWLAWVYGSLAGSDATDRIALLLGCFLLLAVAGWVLGRWPAQTKAMIAAVLIVIAALAIPLTPQKASAVTWQPYSDQTLQQARASGRPVFIDFTAAWCLSCQVNERFVLNSTDVQKALQSSNVMLLKADWTKYDPAITAQLASVGRSGVPTYVIYPAGTNSAADVLPEFLTKSIVLSAIERDTQKKP